MMCFSQNAKAAQIFDWQFYSSDGASLLGSGQLVAGTHSRPDRQTFEWYGQTVRFFEITQMSGSLLGRTITGVVPNLEFNLLDPRMTPNTPGQINYLIPNTWTITSTAIATTSSSSYLVINADRSSTVDEVQIVNGSYINTPSVGIGSGYVLVTPVPEPSALSLLAIGLGGLALVRRRRA
jgi:hypothetical protein